MCLEKNHTTLNSLGRDVAIAGVVQMVLIFTLYKFYCGLLATCEMISRHESITVGMAIGRKGKKLLNV